MTGIRIRKGKAVLTAGSHGASGSLGLRWWILGIGLITGAILLPGCTKKNDQTQGTAPPAQTQVEEMGVTIALEANKSPDPLKAALDRRSDIDHCRWQNLTSTDRKIQLKSGWPFMEKEEIIAVPAYGLSPWYSLDRAKASRDYPYDVTPSLFDGATGEQPVIGVGDGAP
jgi:hypothetical protein